MILKCYHPRNDTVLKRKKQQSWRWQKGGCRIKIQQRRAKYFPVSSDTHLVQIILLVTSPESSQWNDDSQSIIFISELFFEIKLKWLSPSPRLLSSLFSVVSWTVIASRPWTLWESPNHLGSVNTVLFESLESTGLVCLIFSFNIYIGVNLTVDGK